MSLFDRMDKAIEDIRFQKEIIATLPENILDYVLWWPDVNEILVQVQMPDEWKAIRRQLGSKLTPLEDRYTRDATDRIYYNYTYTPNGSKKSIRFTINLLRSAWCTKVYVGEKTYPAYKWECNE